MSKAVCYAAQGSLLRGTRHFVTRHVTRSVVPQVRSPQYPQYAVRAAQYAAKDPPFGYCG